MLGNWIQLVAIVLCVGGFLVGFWRADRVEAYEPVWTKYSIWLGSALFVVYLVFFFQWKSLLTF